MDEHGTSAGQMDLPPEPEWVRRLRAKGYGVRVGTLGPPGLPYEPEIDFSVPEPRERAVWKQVVAAARKLFGSRTKPRLSRGRFHAPVP